MHIIVILLLLFAVVLFVIAAFVPVPRVNLIALGLALVRPWPTQLELPPPEQP